MICKKCKKEIKDGSAFCPNCGTKVAEAKTTKKVEKVEAPVAEKSSKAPIIIIIVIVGSLFLIGLLIVVSLVVIPIITRNYNTPRINTNTTITPTTPSTTTPSTTTPSTTTPSTTNEETTLIGSDKYGYLTLPGRWYSFYDVSGTKSGLQYTKDSVWIVSIDAMEKTSSINAESLAKTALYNMKYGTEKVEKATGATVKVGSYTAYQVYGYYPDDNIWLVEWFFEPGNGKVHYISVEGNDYTSNYFKIPDTFKLTK